ncbi:MAG: hypothetical protein U1F36_03205 [Planctomycetota bacterium]
MRTLALSLFVCCALLPCRAQDDHAAPAPWLGLRVQGAGDDGRFDPQGGLLLVVEIRHPSSRGPAPDDDFVLDPDGGFASAIDIVVRDERGAERTWPFVRCSAAEPKPLRLSPRGRATVMFELAPNTLTGSAGRVLLRARLHATSGSFRDEVWSDPLLLQVLAPSAPTLRVAAPEPALVHRGWPWLLRVELLDAGPDALRASPVLSWTTEGGDTAPLQAELLPLPGTLAPGEGVTFRYRIAADTSRAIPAGRLRIAAQIEALAVAAEAEIVCADVPAVPTAEQEQERDRALVRDAISEAELLRAGIEKGDTERAAREEAVREMARVLRAADARATAMVAAHPEDASAVLLLAAVCAAQYDEDRAAVLLGAAGRAPRPLPERYATLLRESLAGAEALPALPTVDPKPVPTPTPPVPTAAPSGAVSTGEGKDLDARFAADPLGQWASTAEASSQYSTPSWGATQVIGAPDVTSPRDDGRAWAPGASDRGEEWLRVGFAAAVRATGLRVRQNFHPGAIRKVELRGASGESLVVFAGVDPNTYTPDGFAWFVLSFPATAFAVQGVTITLDTAAVPGWNEIDAVQLVGAAHRP